jgi:hypothetical protein
MIIERNTILYTSGNAIKIHGNPPTRPSWMETSSRMAAAAMRSPRRAAAGSATTSRGPSTHGEQRIRRRPMAELGSCDFFGDGRQDRFMATGVTWWAKSPVTQQWRYLNTMKERLPQLQLGDIDGDAVCDVALPSPRPDVIPPRTYSKSGTSPWKPTRVVR